jgi:VanZ family protein
MDMDRLNPKLKWKILWLACGWSLIGLVVTLSLIPPPPPSTPFINLPYIDKLGHFLAYATLMGWFIQLYHSSHKRVQYVIGFIALGISLEILQGIGGIRHADWQDAVANSVGVLFAWRLGKTQCAYFLETFEAWCRRYV